MRTAEGEIPLQVPQVRQTPEPFQSKLLNFLRGHTDVLQRLIAEMYARGLSTRDIEDAFRDGTGQCLISASAVSELTDRLWEDHEAFTRRDLSGFAVEYLFLDAIYESLRLPAAHRKHVRSTNLIERSFLEERRRTKIIQRFFDERSCLKLVYPTPVRASQRWHRIPVTDRHREQLRHLRQELGVSVLRHAVSRRATKPGREVK